MFFGRQELLDRIYREVTTGPLGQCFVLYGQKRSGKSSVLRQLSNRLRAPALTLYLSLGTIDTARAERSFVQACIDALYERLVHDFDMTDVVEHNWPREFQVEASPIESFRRSVRAATRLLQARKGWRDVRPVFLIDEFTYIYEYIREGLLTPAFMRQWKSLSKAGRSTRCWSARTRCPASRRRTRTSSAWRTTSGSVTSAETRRARSLRTPS